MSNIRNHGNELETILRNYLKCNYPEFKVKSNGYLQDNDWQSSIIFALGVKYGESNRSEEMKTTINSFICNDLQGTCMDDIINRYDYYGFSTKDEAYEYIDEIIKKVKEILNS